MRVGAFGYRGDGEGILFRGTGQDSGFFVENKAFTRAGFDVNIYWRALNLIAAFVRGRDTLAVSETISVSQPNELRFEEDFNFKGWFTELDYVFLPWLHGAFRYERLDPSEPGSESFERVTVNGTAPSGAFLQSVLLLADVIQSVLPGDWTKWERARRADPGAMAVRVSSLAGARQSRRRAWSGSLRRRVSPHLSRGRPDADGPHQACHRRRRFA